MDAGKTAATNSKQEYENFDDFAQRSSDRALEQQLGFSTHNPNRMTADDVSLLAAFAYHSHPDIFQDVLAAQPAIVKFRSSPLVGAALGAIAAKWLVARIVNALAGYAGQGHHIPHQERQLEYLWGIVFNQETP